MAIVNFRYPYELNPELYDDTNASRLDRMHKSSNRRSVHSNNDYVAGGLYGRIFAPEREQDFLESNSALGKISQRTFDSNFLKLARISNANTDQQSNAGSFVDRPTGQTSQISGAPWDRSALTLAGFRLPRTRGVPAPIGTTTSSVPTPGIPDSWHYLWPLLKFFPEVTRGLLVGEEFGFSRNDNRALNGDPRTMLPRTTPDGGTHASPSGSSLDNPREMPPNNGGPQGGALGIPLWLDKRQRQLSSTHDGQPSPEQRDPNFRQLSRIPSRSPDSGAFEASGAPVPQPAAEEGFPPARSDRIDDFPDIPDFLRRQAPVETPISSSERPFNNPWPSSGNGNGNWGNGSGGGGDEYDEECNKMRKEAHEICVDAFASGTTGDIFKRWRSNHPTGPFSKPSGKPWTISDCKNGLISEACGGGAYERPPEPAVRRERAKRELARRRKQ
jgi:hypothetical protein